MVAQVQFGVVGFQRAVAFDGELRILVLLVSERDGFAADVSSVEEQDFECAVASAPTVVFAPQGTDPEVPSSMESLFEQVVSCGAVAATMTECGQAPEFFGGTDDRAGLKPCRPRPRTRSTACADARYAIRCMSGAFSPKLISTVPSHLPSSARSSQPLP